MKNKNPSASALSFFRKHCGNVEVVADYNTGGNIAIFHNIS